MLLPPFPIAWTARRDHWRMRYQRDNNGIGPLSVHEPIDLTAVWCRERRVSTSSYRIVFLRQDPYESA